MGFQPVFTHIAEVDPAHRERVAQKWGFDRSSDSVETLAADGEVDAFLVVVNPARLQDVIPALAATGKPIFTEKPPGAGSEEARYFASLIPQTHLVAFNRRFHPLITALKEKLEGVELNSFQASMFRHGRLDSYLARENPMNPPFFQVTGIHLIDSLRYLLGDLEVADLQSLETRPGATDGRMFRARALETDVKGQVAILPTCGWNEERIELHAGDVSFRLAIHLDSGAVSSLRIYRKGICELEMLDESERGELWCHGYICEHLEFLQAIREGRPTRSTLSSGAVSLQLAESIETGFSA